jgi:dTDP-glucose 4,6-dehydratase
MKILVTGCLGFIMSGFVRKLLTDPSTSDWSVRGVARGTNQRHTERLAGFLHGHPQFEFIHTDLAEEASGLCDGVDVVLHGAARTFVDRSIRDPEPFVKNNVLSTIKILEDARRYGVKKFMLCSTDEVLGSIKTGSYKEDAPPSPSNPYASSKLAAEGLCQSYAKTYGLNTLIMRFENVYGQMQGPEKVIPTFCRALSSGGKCPVYGNGDHVRQWLHLDDCVAGIVHLMELDTVPGEIFHVAGQKCLTNLELAKSIIRCFKFKEPPENFIRFIDDTKIRPGHDFRYALCTDKINRTGWNSRVELEEGIAETVSWYQGNRGWLS